SPMPRAVPAVFVALSLMSTLTFTVPAHAAEEKKMADTDPAIAAIDKQIADAKIDKTKAGWKVRLPKPTKVSFTAGKKYLWVLDTTKGPIEVRLLPDAAPMHVTSTIYLTNLGFYDGLAFHRVIPKFMAQGGDPLGNGTGGPGYGFNGEFSPTVKHDRGGLLSMANTGAP